MRFNYSLILMITGLGLMLLSGIPAVLEFMNMQNFPYNPTLTLFPSHWFIMIYGFFGALIGNEILVPLSVEWIGRKADDKILVAFAILTILSSLLSFVSFALAIAIEIVTISILLYYSRVYLQYSKLGLKPSTYNLLLVSSIILVIIILGFQLGLGYPIPYLNLLFPTSVVLAIMARDIGLVSRTKVNEDGIILAWIFLIPGIALYSTLFGEFFLFLAWLFSFFSSGLFRFKGRNYPKIHLLTAWIFLLSSVIFYTNYDIFIHSIAVGFLFNTVFGVDVVIMDMFINAFGIRAKIKPSYIPYILVNVGLVSRIAYDLGVNSPVLIFCSPLQGLGILSFFIITLRQLSLTDKA